MNILLTNDDGIDAIGIQTLQACLKDEHNLFIAAPATEKSGCSHRMTFDQPIEVTKTGHQSFKVNGTPCDCARIGLHHLFDERIDLVVSGINAGANLGCDIYLSGTVAAAREATFFDTPAIAISQYTSDWSTFDWKRTERLAKRVLQSEIAKLENRTNRERAFVNINLPEMFTLSHQELDDLALIHCKTDSVGLPIDYQISKSVDNSTFNYDSVYQNRKRTPGCDVDVCFSNSVAISRIEI